MFGSKHHFVWAESLVQGLARQADIQPDDHILAINDQDAQKMQHAQLVACIKGASSQLQLTLIARCEF
jgi:C-terminal processing protease CtpA/Prc